MVLIRTMALLLFAGCIKAKPPVLASASADVATTVTLASISRASTPDKVPARLFAQLGTQLTTHNLNLLQVDAPPDFNTRRTTAHRLAWLSDNASNAPHILLAEARATRYGLVSGRYRWVVDVTLTMAATTESDQPIDISFSVPVHLQHTHQAEAAALEAAIPAITRRTGRLVNDYLGGAR